MTPLLDRHDLVLADLDGTLYQGREAIPGAVDAVRAAGERGVRTLYVTNNASRSPDDVAAHLAELGYPAEAVDVATSSQAAAALLAEQLPDGAKVLVVGTAALVAEISAVAPAAVSARPPSSRASTPSCGTRRSPRPVSRCGRGPCGWRATSTRRCRASAVRCPATGRSWRSCGRRRGSSRRWRASRPRR